MPLRHIILSCLFLLLVVPRVQAESPVWRISKGDSHIYLGGTFHLLSSLDHPLPAAFTQAYKDADTLVFETDLEKARTPAFQMAMMKALTFQDERTLQSALKPETFKALEEFLTSRGLQLESFAKFTPGGIGLMIAIMEYQRMGMQPMYGVDAVYHQKAIADGKMLSLLETPEEQLEFIANIGEGQGDSMVAYTLQEIDRLPELISTLKQAWRDGNLEQLDKLALEDSREQFPRTHQSLIADRNNAWLTPIKKMFQDEQTEFVLVGALHLAGPEGLIAQLKKQGYKIENL